MLSDKALQTANEIMWGDAITQTDIANVIDTHTAQAVQEAVAPYQQVLAQAEKALLKAICTDKNWRGFVGDALAAITKLKGAK